MDSLVRASRVPGALTEAALARINQVGLNRVDEGAVIDQVLAAVCEVVGCEHAVVLLQDEKENVPRRLYTVLDDGTRVTMPFQERGTLLYSLARAGLPQAIHDVPSYPRAGHVLARVFRARQALFAPLRLGSANLGIVGAINTDDGIFDSHDFNALTVLADRAALALDAARHNSRLQQDVEELEFLVRKLYESDHNKTEFLSLVSHEIKGPMTNILGFSKALREQWDSVAPHKREHFLELMLKEARRAARLVEEVLDLARLESGTLSCDLQPVDLEALVREVVATNRDLLARHRVQLEIAPDLPPVQADEDRIAQVLGNVLSNAARYSPPSTTITLDAGLQDESGSTILVAVSDEGPGVPTEERERLFEKFVRLDASDGGQGNGLGLFIARGIVRAHGGEIWMEHRPGAGACFCFTLRPAARMPGETFA